MRLYKNGDFVIDTWRALADEEPLPAVGDVIVTLARWRGEHEVLAASGLRLGLRLQPAETLLPVADRLDTLQLIALAFPKFTDGRAYSTARRLRDSLGYKGELRATGDVLLDQIPLMRRVGFDAFEITHAPTIRALERGALAEPAVAYQRHGPAIAGRSIASSLGAHPPVGTEPPA